MAGRLKDAVNKGTFWSLPDELALELLRDAFVPELERLQAAPMAAESATTREYNDARLVPSRFLFDKDFDEVNRTLTSILSLKWLVSGDYQAFAGCQTAESKLQLPSFDSLRRFVQARLKTPDDSFTLLVSLMINDLGKVQTLARDIESATSQCCQDLNHDAILYKAVEADLVPCIDLLSDQQREELLLGLRMGTHLNIGQLAQAENVPGSLEDILAMRGHEHAFDVKFIEQLIDIAGAAGHVDCRCAKTMTETSYQSFCAVYTVLTNIISGTSTLRQGYDDVLRHRAETLQQMGFPSLCVSREDDRALLRLMTMGRTSSYEQAEWFDKAYQSLSNRVRHGLVLGLNVDGYMDGRAILPYYMPALIQTALKNTHGKAQDKCDALSSLMRFLARVLDGTYPDPNSPDQIVEKDLMFAKETISSTAFRDDPTVLDRLPMKPS